MTNKPADAGFRGALRSLIRPERVIKTAVEGIDLTVDPGELVLLLGPNGAGKSTLIKVLTGVIRPTSGEVRVAGVVPRTNQKAHARSIGVVFGQRSQLWWDLPVRQSYVILQNIYDIPPETAARRLAEFDEILGLSEFWDVRLRHLSLGQRVRADLAGALLHDPAVIFLDEPTIGMDVVAKDQVRRFLRRQVAEHGRCVLLTTHDMNEVKRLGSRVVVINHGRIVSDGDITELARRFGGGFRIRVTLRRASAEVDLAGLKVVDREGPLVTLAPLPVDRDEQSITVQAAMAKVVRDLEIEGIAIEEDDLEDVLRSAFQHAGADPAGHA